VTEAARSGAAPREIPPPPVWGVTRFLVGERPVAWTIGRDEMQAEIGAAAGTWPQLGVGRGDRILFVSMLSECPYVWPLMIGALLTGAQMSPADATASDAPRVSMFCRNLELTAVVGVGSATLDGLEEAGRDPVGTFAGVPILLARPGAYERLRAGGLRPHRFVLLGPCLAMAREAGGPALVDAARWTVETAPDGELLVSASTPRLQRFDRQATGVRGEVRTVERDGTRWWAVVPEPVVAEPAGR
jgi:hypothetical protein